jgi:hypothetical protein
MLIIRCAACRKKLWQYDKIGKGEVLRCHKSRIEKEFGNCLKSADDWKCVCGKTVGIDKGSFVKMISRAFTYSGTKRTG